VTIVNRPALGIQAQKEALLSQNRIHAADRREHSNRPWR
jgi:hypothetical protein